MRSLLLLVVTGALACTRPAPATPDATAVDAAVPVVDAGPPPETPYPAAWVRASFSEHPGPCERLVYKDGCRVLRKGRVEVVVTLDDGGGVVAVELERNTVRVDGPMVEACVRRDLSARRFHAPAPGMTRRFRHVVVLADMC